MQRRPVLPRIRRQPSHHRPARKSAIVTIKRKSRFGDTPDLSPDELNRRPDAADALCELVRQSTQGK